MACLFVDDDKFKSINDTYGHSFVDVLLAVARF
ncbi:diguanylate cyclase [Vibrio lentus]|nr:diguanylate cyclase [Vibrio lentus]